MSGPMPYKASRPGARLVTRGDDELIQSRELAVEELSAPPQLPQRDPGGIADSIAGPGPQRRQLADQGGDRVPGEPRAQVIGPVTIRDLAWLMVWVRSERALRLATISARIASRRRPTVPNLQASRAGERSRPG